MPNRDDIETQWDEFLVAVLERVADGRLDAKTFAGLTPEQRSQYRANLVQRDKDGIAEGLGRHNKPDEE